MGKDTDGKLAFRNPVKQLGWAQVYHVLTLDRELSDGAFRTYALLLMYARREQGCWPGVERLAQDLGRGERTVARYLSELRERGFITRQQRMRKTAITWIEDLEDIYGEEEIAIHAKNGRDEPIHAKSGRDEPIHAKNGGDEAAIPAKNGRDSSMPEMAGHEEQARRTNNDDGELTERQRQSLELLLGLGVHRAVARGLAERCRPEEVEAWVRYAHAAPTLSNPPGFVVAKLQAGELSPGSSGGEEADRRRYIEGEYSDFIQH